MLPLLPLAPSAGLALLLLFALALLALALELSPSMRRALFGALLTLLGLIASGIWAWYRGLHLGVIVIWSLLPLLAAVVASLPFAIAVQRFARLGAPKPVSGPKLSRRAALGIPLSAAATAALGFAKGTAPAELRMLSLSRAALHPDLVGLRILQLSDLHLGSGLDARDIARLVRELAPARPDVVVLTGDVADKLDALDEALPLFDSLAPRFGTFAVLGNHEHMSGVRNEMIDAYRRSRVRLLVNETALLEVGRARLAIVGIDDPFGKHEPDFFATRIAAAVSGTNDASFRVLLSHRPEALEAAADAGIDLVLSGHTHGGQLGWWGRSVFEHLGLARLMWGFYRRRGTTLYTSAGAGDWFPFRLGCPREAPMFVLSD